MLKRKTPGESNLNNVKHESNGREDSYDCDASDTVIDLSTVPNPNLDLSSLNDPLNDPLTTTSIVPLNNVESNEDFTIQFNGGLCLLDANNFLLLLNSSKNANVDCELVQEEEHFCHLIMKITSLAPPHLSKCVIKCLNMNKGTKKTEGTIVSRFSVDFKQLSNILKYVDRQQVIVIRRNENRFTVEYETDDQCFDVDFHQVHVGELLPDVPASLQYQYQASVVTKKLKKFVDHARDIDNSMVIVRVYRKGKVQALKLELDNQASEIKQNCATIIGTRDVKHTTQDTPLEAEEDVDQKEIRRQEISFKEVCRDQQNLVMIAVFNKNDFMNVAKINVPSIVMNLGMDPNAERQKIDPNTRQPMFYPNGQKQMERTPHTPGMFAYNTDDVEMSIYLGQFDNPASEAEIEFVRRKLPENDR